MLDFAIIHISAYNVYYVKLNVGTRTTAQSNPFTVTFPHTSVQWPFGHCTCQLFSEFRVVILGVFNERCY